MNSWNRTSLYIRCDALWAPLSSLTSYVNICLNMRSAGNFSLKFAPADLMAPTQCLKVSHSHDPGGTNTCYGHPSTDNCPTDPMLWAFSLLPTTARQSTCNGHSPPADNSSTEHMHWTFSSCRQQLDRTHAMDILLLPTTGIFLQKSSMGIVRWDFSSLVLVYRTWGSNI